LAGNRGRRDEEEDQTRSHLILHLGFHILFILWRTTAAVFLGASGDFGVAPTGEKEKTFVSNQMQFLFMDGCIPAIQCHAFYKKKIIQFHAMASMLIDLVN
jgi:hypothetical protein